MSRIGFLAGEDNEEIVDEDFNDDFDEDSTSYDSVFGKH